METRIVKDVGTAPKTPRQVARSFRALLDGGARLLPAGDARRDPGVLLEPGYLPRHEVALFDAVYWLADYRFDDDLNFLVGYVGLRRGPDAPVRRIYPRIFYKDSSLVWRVATHVVRTDDENWIGKGDVKVENLADGEYLSSAEETSNLPFEIQGALDSVSRAHPGRHRRDAAAVGLILRAGPSDRMRPYADFTRPRRRAAARYRINGGRRVARIARRGDPGSLRFAPGFAPDLRAGVVEVTESGSRLYGGHVRKYRILSENRRIQYQFIASPTHVWINQPQALTTELMSYGTRTVDVLADEEVVVPGYEFHYLDDSVEPPSWHSQIPAGFAGAASDVDPARADASGWIEQLPIVRSFRQTVLGRRARVLGR